MIQEKLYAQISLLDDPDKKVFKIVRENIVTKGESAISELEEAWDSTQIDLVHSRIEDIIHDINFNEIINSVQEWKFRGEKDWFEILFLISKFYFHNINKESLKREISKIKNDIWLELNDNLTALEKIKVFNRIFYDKYGFAKYKSEHQYKNSFFLSELLINKKGNDLSLALLYLLLTDSLGLPVCGIDLPGNMILGYQMEDISSDYKEFSNEILFYINPLNKGMAFGADVVYNFLDKNELDLDDKFFKASSRTNLIIRYIDELKLVIERDHEVNKLNELKKIQELVINS
jgi:hypothetical protein